MIPEEVRLQITAASDRPPAVSDSVGFAFLGKSDPI
jgi:hypothetical protein